MSVDSLFQHIVLTQQQAQERRRILQEVKSDVSSCHEKITEVEEKLRAATGTREDKKDLEVFLLTLDRLGWMVNRMKSNLVPSTKIRFLGVILDSQKQLTSLPRDKISDMQRKIKVTILLEKGFQRDLVKMRQEGLEIQKGRLLRENQDLLCNLEDMKKEMTAEEERFMKEVLAYNNDYGLTVDRKELLRGGAEAESQSLDEEAEELGREIESLRGENIHLKALHRQRNMIQRELSDFQETLRGLDKEISAAAGVTKSLEAEKLAISQRPQNDGECLR
ncbi:coiled-coil domain-containing protein 172 [Bufo gargarizans]|uniref:coiled-coil domain-containing protein 172 n=1 Tax=Bufo gargarizans TaxID=30331 RepID=UPI001CF3E106|nr:coiled-coil domain-containing protein 172 [Bufo gargarizans]